MRIALFVPCFVDVLFPETGMATVSILRRLGHEVWYPEDQTCCGQIHFNTGYQRSARRLCERFLNVFAEAEVVVAPSASCVAMVREQYSILTGEGSGEDPVEHAHSRSDSARARAPDSNAASGGGAGRSSSGVERLAAEIRDLAERTFELSEFLVHELGVADLGARFPYRVALHSTCHSMRGIDVGEAPQRLLRAVDGLELVFLPRSEECCGFGGTFAVKNSDTSLALMDDKIRTVAGSGAQVLTAVDDSCLMHLAGGMRRQGLLTAGGLGSSSGIRVMHLARILAAEEGKGT